MKLKKTLSFLLAGALLGQSLPAHSMNLGDMAFTVTASGGLISILNCVKLDKQVTSELKLPQKELDDLLHENFVWNRCYPKESLKAYEDDLHKQLNELANLHGLQRKIRFICNDHFSALAIPKVDYLCIPKEDYEYLLEITSQNKNKNIFFCKDALSQSDRQKIACIASSIYHELGHLKNDHYAVKTAIECIKPAITGYLIAASLPKDGTIDPLNKVAVGAGIASGVALGQQYPISALIGGLIAARTIPSDTDSPTYQFARQSLITGACVASAGLIKHFIRIAFGRYDETLADDNIPNDPELLRASVKFFKEADHREEMDMREKVFSELTEENFKLFMRYFNKVAPTARLLLLSHPSNEWRAQRFQNRLDAIAAQAIRERENVIAALKRYQGKEDNPLKNIKPSPAIMNALTAKLNKEKAHGK